MNGGSGKVTDKLSGAGETAQAQLMARSDSEVSGHVTFRQVDGGVRVTATIDGLTEGEHGFHVHETGDCSAADGNSAGGHYSPRGNPHGAPSDTRDRHHAGDLGNLVADRTGKASFDEIFGFLAMAGPESIIGRAVIVHEEADDLKSQPSGAAGDRVACGVIVAVDN